MVGYEQTDPETGSEASLSRFDNPERPGYLDPKPGGGGGVAPKGPTYGFSPWEALDSARRGALPIPFVAHVNPMLRRPNRCQWSCQLARTSCGQAHFTSCASSGLLVFTQILLPMGLLSLGGFFWGGGGGMGWDGNVSST